MLNEIIILFAASLATGIGGWVFARRKNRAEAKTVELGNLEKIIEMWQETAGHFKGMTRELMEANKAVTTDLTSLRSENENHQKEIEKLKVVVESLKRENRSLVTRIKELEKQYDAHDIK